MSADGLGYLSVGQPVPVVTDITAIMRYDATACASAGAGIAAGSPGAGAWQALYPDGPSSLVDKPPFDVGPVQSEADPVRVIEVWSPLIKTSTGVGAGSTAEELSAAYGSQLLLDSASNSDVYVLKGAHSELLFEVAKADSGLPSRELGTVVWMRVVPLDSEFLHIANTDAGGECSA